MLQDRATAGLLGIIEKGQAVLMDRHEALEVQHQELRSFVLKMLDLILETDAINAQDTGALLKSANRFDIGVDECGYAIDLKVED